jgi:DNA-binding transcriptional MerR regulator
MVEPDIRGRIKSIGETTPVMSAGVRAGAIMRIGELADRTGVSVRSLRYYEDQGLLVPSRTSGGHRNYPASAADRVIRIQELYAAGLNSAKIREILPCMRDADGGPSEQATPLLAATLAKERDRIDRQVRELQRTRDVLDDVIATATKPVVAPRVRRTGGGSSAVGA